MVVVPVEDVLATAGVYIHRRAVRILVVGAECRAAHVEDALLQALALLVPGTDRWSKGGEGERVREGGRGREGAGEYL